MPKINKLEQKVMKKIKSSKIKMRPRIYFAAGSILLALGITLSSLLAIFLINIISFRLRTERPLDYLRFGRHGLPAFAHLFPWALFLIAVVSIFLGISLLKKYDFSYQRNFLITILGIILLSLFLGIGIDRLGANRSIAVLPKFKKLYQNEFLTQKWLVGEIITINQDSLKVVTPNGREVVIILEKDTEILNASRLQPGIYVKIVGLKKNGSFSAKGIMPFLLPKNLPPQFRRQGLPRLRYFNNQRDND